MKQQTNWNRQRQCDTNRSGCNAQTAVWLKTKQKIIFQFLKSNHRLLNVTWQDKTSKSIIINRNCGLFQFINYLQRRRKKRINEQNNSVIYISLLPETPQCQHCDATNQHARQHQPPISIIERRRWNICNQTQSWMKGSYLQCAIEQQQCTRLIAQQRRYRYQIKKN